MALIIQDISLVAFSALVKVGSREAERHLSHASHGCQRLYVCTTMMPSLSVSKRLLLLACMYLHVALRVPAVPAY